MEIIFNSIKEMISYVESTLPKGVKVILKENKSKKTVKTTLATSKKPTTRKSTAKPKTSAVTKRTAKKTAAKSVAPKLSTPKKATAKRIPPIKRP